MPAITDLKYGEIGILGKTIYSDVVVWWDGKNALLTKTHKITLPLMETVIKKKPESVVIGVGLEGTVHISPAAAEKLKEKGIRLFVDRTENAIEIYNAFEQIGKKVAGIFHVTL